MRPTITFLRHGETILVVTHNGFLRSIRFLCHQDTSNLFLKNLDYFTITEKDFR